jgi:ectoine hydroxylase-related dioxygenase (phytanoyl-CoA dioxygenase family)
MAQGLSDEQKRFFDDNGYVVVRGVFTKAECAAWRAELHELSTRLTTLRGEINATWPSVAGQGTVNRHCHDVQFHVASMTRLICDPRFTAPLQSIIGPNVQLHHTKMFIKPPEKGSPFPLHQDYHYFPHQRDSMLAAVVHFDDATIEKGCIRVVPGSHKLGALKPAAGVHDNSLPTDRFPIESAVPCEAATGDVLIFSYLTIHGSGINRSPEHRTTMLVQVRDPEDQPKVESHLSQGQGMMLAGCDPRAVARPEWEQAMAR